MNIMKDFRTADHIRLQNDLGKFVDEHPVKEPAARLNATLAVYVQCVEAALVRGRAVDWFDNHIALYRAWLVEQVTANDNEC